MFCDQNCNECPLINHANSRLLTHVLNKLHDKFGNDVYKIVQNHCPNMTVCKDCRIDDFVHDEDCDLIKDCPECIHSEIGINTCEKRVKKFLDANVGEKPRYPEHLTAKLIAEAMAICADGLIKAIDRNTDMMHETTQDLILCLNKNDNHKRKE